MYPELRITVDETCASSYNCLFADRICAMNQGWVVCRMLGREFRSVCQAARD